MKIIFKSRPYATKVDEVLAKMDYKMLVEATRPIRETIGATKSNKNAKVRFLLRGQDKQHQP